MNLLTLVRPILATYAAMLFLATSLLPARAENRTFDGTGNNLTSDAWGAAEIPLLRMSPATYVDGSTLNELGLPNVRSVSNMICDQTIEMPNARAMSGFVWQWGQFVDHDIDLTPSTGLPASIAVPSGDPYFDPFDTGAMAIPLIRSKYEPGTGDSAANPRQQVNVITSYIDASNVYGSDASRSAALRTFSGGLLKTSVGNLLPLNTMGLDNANDGPFADETLFAAGDVRANEQAALTAMHTLFMREHNRLAGQIASENGGWTDEQVFQRARKFVGAQMQVITYQEFLPALLGSAAPSLPGNYDPSLDASIANEFSTGLYRFGHSMIAGELMRYDSDGSVAPGGHLALRDAFFNPTLLSSPNEIDYLLVGLAQQASQELDTRIVDDLRNFLFGPPGAGGLDLASLNMQRGRDHGLPNYNALRVDCGLAPITSFADITSDPAMQIALENLYGTVDAIDTWVGALSEDHMPGSSVGELMQAGLVDQFERLRDGDRFWLTNDDAFSAADLALLQSTTLSDIIARNTGVTSMRSDLMFAVPEPSTLVPAMLGLLGLLGFRRRNAA